LQSCQRDTTNAIPAGADVQAVEDRLAEAELDAYSRTRTTMKTTVIALALVAALAFPSATVEAATSTDFSAAKSAYAAKKAECKQKAKAKHFGIHWIKRNRWIRDCIAGAH
jgi:hypothetical protein